MLIESTPLAGLAIDPKASKVVGKVGYLPPPTPLTGGGYGHGLAIGAKANADEAAKDCAGLFIAWATSKENEQRRLAAGQFGELNRTSIMNSDEFARRYGPDLGKALEETGAVTAVNFWQDAQWPDLGDRWGIILEELVTGTRTDIKEASTSSMPSPRSWSPNATDGEFAGDSFLSPASAWRSVPPPPGRNRGPHAATKAVQQGSHAAILPEGGECRGAWSDDDGRDAGKEVPGVVGGLAFGRDVVSAATGA